ncbi:VWA domain-containing protein [Streptomyces shenzhenensis]
MDREWELKALCRSREPEIWFSQKSLSRAKKVCLEAILARESQTADTLRSGTIAGLTGAQRAKVAAECSTGGQAQVHNAGFFHAATPRTVTDTGLYDGITSQFAQWLTAVRAAGILV